MSLAPVTTEDGECRVVRLALSVWELENRLHHPVCHVRVLVKEKCPSYCFALLGDRLQEVGGGGYREVNEIEIHDVKKSTKNQ